MKKIYVSPVSEIYSAEMGEMICASKNDPNGVVGSDGPFGTEYPNGGNGDPNFNGYIDDPNAGPPSTAKEYDLWGDW
ncbi:MAG: hypothetical protein IKX65_04935 [Prevotella sp.]|nr:hypothetical protein [Prevotella sp.]